MMAPHVYEQARANAPIHVQLWQRSGLSARPRGSSVQVIARVVRIFRDRDHAVHVGQQIRFHVPIIAPVGPGGPTLGGTIHHDWDRLSRQPWLEAFMESSGGQLELVFSQIAAIRHPTWHPVCGPDEKGFLCAGNVP
jgi:hypothetical protein